MSEKTFQTIIEVLIKALEEEKLMRAYYEEKAKNYEKQLDKEVKENA